LTYSLLKTLKTSSSTLDEEKFINVQKWFLETETTMDNMTRELGIEQEAQPFGRGNIRVGELDEEIRGGIEIQQEKPMVYCAMAMNMDENVLEDNKQLKVLINDSIFKKRSFSFSRDQNFLNDPNFIRMNIAYRYDEIERIYHARVVFYRVDQSIKMADLQGNFEEFNEQLLKIIYDVESNAK